MGIISNEIDKLISILDEGVSVSCKSIELNMLDEHGKSMFIEEKIIPFVLKKQNDQSQKVTEAFNSYYQNMKYEKQNKREY